MVYNSFHTNYTQKQNTKKNKDSILKYLERFSSSVQKLAYRAGIERTSKKSYWLEEKVEVGDGRAAGLSAVWGEGQAAISLTPDFDGTHIPTFESMKLEGWCVGDLVYQAWALLRVRPWVTTLRQSHTPEAK